MKNNLLMTTALVAIVGCVHSAAAQEATEDTSIYQSILVSEGQKFSMFGDDNDANPPVQDITVEKGGKLTIANGADIKTTTKTTPTDDIVVKGTLVVKSSTLEAGNDTDDLPNNSNIRLEDASVTLTDSNLEANGELCMIGGSLTTASTQVQDKIYTLDDHNENGELTFIINENEDEAYSGVWAEKTISAENTNTTLTNSYLAAGEGITITGGEHTLTNSAIIAGDDESSDIAISDSTLNLTGSVITGNNITFTNNTLTADQSDIVADQNIVFDGGEYTSISDDNTILALNGDITIKGGTFANNDFVTPNGDINVEGGYLTDDATVTDGNWDDPDSDHLDIENQNLNIKGGTVKFINANTTSAINNNISGGKVILDRGGITSWTGNINVSGGEIDISGNKEEADHSIGLYARQQLNISDGTININGEGITIDNIADIFEDDYDTYDLNISGGTINVSGGTSEINEIASSKNINFTGGTINVNENSALGFAGGNDRIAATVITGKEAVLNISGEVDLGTGSAVDKDNRPVDNKKGTLSGNGTINFLTSSANLNGDVSGVTLAFEDDNTLSTAITGTIEDAVLNVNQGTLAVDKDASLNNLTVAENAGLTVNRAITTNSFTSSGKITGNEDITASGNLTVNGGSINNDNADLESWKTITITNADDVQLNNSADLTALEKLVIEKSRITAQNDDELWSLGNIEISDSTLDLTNSSINTLYENLDDIYENKVSKPDTAGNITISDTNLTLKESVIETEGDIKLSNSTVNLDTDSALTATKDLTIDGGSLTAKNPNDSWKYDLSVGKDMTVTNADISLENIGVKVAGDVNIKDSTYTLTNAHSDSQNATITNSKMSFDNAELYAFDTLTIKDSTITATGDEPKGENVYICAMGDASVQNSTVELAGDSELTAVGGLDITDSKITMTNAYKTGSTDTVTSGGHFSELSSEKNINIDNSTIDVNGFGHIHVDWYEGAEDNFKAGDRTIKIADNSIVNVSDNSSLGLISAAPISLQSSTLNLGTNSITALYGTELSPLNDGTVSETYDETLKNTLHVKNSSVNINGSGVSISGNLTFEDGGEMNIGTNKATVDGDVTFQSGSAVKMTVNSADEYGSLKANSVTGEEGSTLSLTVDGSIRDKITVTLFDADTVTDNFTRDISNNRYTVTTTDGKSYDIEYTTSASDIVAETGGTSNDMQMSEAWDSIAQNTDDSKISQNVKNVANHLNDLSQNDAKKYTEALTALAPDAAPSVSHTSQQNTQQIFGAVGNRFQSSHMGGGHMGGHRGMSSGDSVGQRVVAWIQGLFNKAKLDDTSSSKGFDSKSYGTALGLESQYTDDVKLGIGYAYTKTDIDGFMRDTDAKTHTAIVYGEYKPNNWYVNGVATYGWSDYSEDKNASGLKVTADYDAETFGLQAMTGYVYTVKGFDIAPEAGLRYLHVKQDSYTDSAGQSISTDDSDILTGVIGLKAGTSYSNDSNIVLKPEVRVAATYDLTDSDADSIVSLANGSSYKVNGDSLDRFGMEFGAGVTAEVNDNIEVSLGYEGKFREDYQDHSGLINFKYKF